MFNAAQNFQEHVDEMLRAGMTPASGPEIHRREIDLASLICSSRRRARCAGAYDDIAIPHGMKKIDWEAEIALAIGKPGKRIKAERALDHVAGFMTTNDVSSRDLQIRPDRPGLRSDWLNGKSHDNFAPMGPFLVPRAFVPDHMKLFIRLTVNGEVKQNGNTSQFIFTPEEQIEYASQHSHAGNRRYFQLRHLRRRRPGHQHVPQGRRRDGDRDRRPGQDAQPLGAEPA